MWWLLAQVPTPPPGGPIDRPPVDKSGLPGGEALAKLVGGLMYMSLLACLVAIVLGAAAWGLSAHSGNYHSALIGRKAVLGGFFGALIIGAAAAIVAFAFGVGQNV